MKYKIGQVWKDKKGSYIKIVDIAKDGRMLATVDDGFYLEYDGDGDPEYGYSDHELVVLMKDEEG